MKEAAKQLNVHPSDIVECCKGNHIRYFNDIFTVVYHGKDVPKEIKRYRQKIIMFDGEKEHVYNSILEAAKDQGIDRKTIYSALKTGKLVNGKKWNKA